MIVRVVSPTVQLLTFPPGSGARLYAAEPVFIASENTTTMSSEVETLVSASAGAIDVITG